MVNDHLALLLLHGWFNQRKEWGKKQITVDNILHYFASFYFQLSWSWVPSDIYMQNLHEYFLDIFMNI